MKKIFSDCLLVSDFDGTLYNETEVPQVNVDAIRHFMAEGGTFAVCTGRSSQSLLRHIHDFPSNAPSIVANGAMIYDYEKNLMVDRRIVPESARPMLKKVMERFPALGVEVYCADQVFVAQNSPWVVEHLNYDAIPNLEMPMDDIPGEWIKVILTGDPQGMGDVMRFLDSCHSADVNYMFTAPYFLEMFERSVHKGSGLELLTQYLGLDMKNTYAVGDYLNDVDLLKTARHSYAVAGAPDELMEVCHGVVCSAQDGAVANVIALIEKR